MQIFYKNTNSRIQKAYEKDLLAIKLRKDQRDTDILIFENRTYLPQGYIKEVIREYYNDLLQGHLGITKTLEIVKRTYARSRMRKEVENYIKEYVPY